ncbi:MAG: glycosyltransferase family 2 protein [Candidatus Bathyarchaeia archaeon]
MSIENLGKVEVSIVFPAYNEAERLEEAVKKTIEALEEFTRSYEVIIAEDGSTDGTDKIASELSMRYPKVRHIHSDRRLGRGLALKNAFNNSRGEILAFMDVDLATDIKHLKTLVESIKEGYDIAIGSRMHPESKVERTLSRRIASKWYNFMVRALLGSKIRDHQCGFKAFKRELILQILKETEATHWFWDTEILVRASRRGCRIKEIPVEWRSGKETKVHLFKDSLTMGWQVLKFWWKLKRQSFSGNRNPKNAKMHFNRN